MVPLLLVLAACAAGGTPSAPPSGASVAPAAATLPAAPAATDPTGPTGPTGAATGSAVAPAAGRSLVPATGGGASAPAPSAPPATVVEEDAGDEAPSPDLPGLVLEAGGLGVITADTHISHLGFGTSARRVRAMVGRIVGPTTAHRRTCPQGRRTVSVTKGFTIVAAGDRFVGWADRGAPDRTLSTADGIAVGLTMAQLKESATRITVRGGDTGAVSWTSGPHGLSGRATSAAAQGLVTVVSSGETC